MNKFITLSHILLYEMLVSIIRRISIMCYLNEYMQTTAKDISLKVVLLPSYILDSSEKTDIFKL